MIYLFLLTYILNISCAPVPSRNFVPKFHLRLQFLDRKTQHSLRCAALPFETCSILTTRQYQLLREIVRRIEVASRPSPLGSTHLPISLWSPISDPSKNESISLPQAPEKHTHSLTVDPIPIQNEYQIYPSYQGSLVKI